ncbi:MAG TPA: DUF5915 domain-containing protein [Candidatus Absconditabacterales bacterium]|nr:DUF5915 domain-containing protein [Candidatus Absconditabacterales bacterium]
MGELNLDYILDKYGDIIKEEINVKDIKGFGNDVKITKMFKPVGSQISSKFGKDTGNIIKFGKMGNIEELGDGKIKVFDPAGSGQAGEGNEWVLEKDDYEIAYQGLEGDDVSIDGDVIAKLDLELTPELEMEGMAREVSRFLNQMRKDADFNVDTKVDMYFDTKDQYMKEVINKFNDFLISEALLKSIDQSKNEGDIVSVFNLDERTVTFILKQ